VNTQEAAKAMLAYDFMNEVEPRRAEGGLGKNHMRWMLDQIASGEVKDEKAHRWLGYAQGLATVYFFFSLEDLKNINLNS